MLILGKNFLNNIEITHELDLTQTIHYIYDEFIQNAGIADINKLCHKVCAELFDGKCNRSCQLSPNIKERYRLIKKQLQESRDPRIQKIANWFNIPIYLKAIRGTEAQPSKILRTNEIAMTDISGYNYSSLKENFNAHACRGVTAQIAGILHYAFRDMPMFDSFGIRKDCKNNTLLVYSITRLSFENNLIYDQIYKIIGVMPHDYTERKRLSENQHALPERYPQGKRLCA